MQANVWCRPSRGRTVVVSLTLVALTAAAVNTVCWRLLDAIVVYFITDTIITAIVPVAVLLINMAVVRQVRRAATNAAANLGVQPHHHQSTSSNSVVPTVMLVVTSIIYVLLYGVIGIFDLLNVLVVVKSIVVLSHETFVIVNNITIVVFGLADLVFVYNFYIYLITGKRFRSELKKLFSCCIRSSGSTAVVVVADAVEMARRAQTNRPV